MSVWIHLDATWQVLAAWLARSLERNFIIFMLNMDMCCITPMHMRPHGPDLFPMLKHIVWHGSWSLAWVHRTSCVHKQAFSWSLLYI